MQDKVPDNETFKLVLCIVNSRMGLAVLVFAIYNFGLSPKIDDLVKSNQAAQATFSRLESVISETRDLQIKLLERCGFKQNPEVSSLIRKRRANI